YLIVDRRVSLPKILPAFRMTENNIAAAYFREHLRTCLTGKGTIIFRTYILSAQRDAVAVGKFTRGRCQGNHGRTYQHINIFGNIDAAVFDSTKQLARFLRPAVHLPVTGY